MMTSASVVSPWGYVSEGDTIKAHWDFKMWRSAPALSPVFKRIKLAWWKGDSERRARACIRAAAFTLTPSIIGIFL
jgi:hypothetical protein